MRFPEVEDNYLPDVGVQRIITRFLWLPLCLRGEWRWLEKCGILQEMRPLLTEFGSGPSLRGWVDICWVNSDKRS